VKRVCVFCGSSSGADPQYQAAARQTGEALVRHGLGLVYGGGGIGLMKHLADAVLVAGGQVIGVIPESLMARELGHREVADLRVVGSMHERKALMAELSDAFIAMPGGYGTLEEFCEVVTWSQLGLHAKPCGLLNVKGYYDPLTVLLDHAVGERFLRPEHRELVLIDEDPERLLEQLASYRPPALDKWLDRDET
jgi:uncharacterized protein (TIGR00730 family)